MKDNRSNTKIEEIIRASVKVTDTPTTEQNNKLKAALYQQEALLQKRPAAHTLSLWFLPMVLNLVIFSLMTVLALAMIENIYLSYFAAGICFYVSMAGILLTIVGVKRANIKKAITIRIEKRGLLVWILQRKTSFRFILELPLSYCCFFWSSVYIFWKAMDSAVFPYCFPYCFLALSFSHYVPLLFLQLGYIRIVKGEATTQYYGQL